MIYLPCSNKPLHIVPCGEVDSIRVVTPPDKTAYISGEPIDITGMVVKAYSNGEEYGIVPNSAITLTPSTASGAGSQTITVEWHSLTDTFTINVSSLPDSIDITTLPTKTSYTDGESIDITGMVAKAYLNGNLWEEMGYTGGVIPNNELSVTPNTAVYPSSGGKTSDLQTVFSQPISVGQCNWSGVYRRDDNAEFSLNVTTDDPELVGVIAVQQDLNDRVTLFIASPNNGAGVYTTTTWVYQGSTYTSHESIYCDGSYEYNGQVVYYSNDTTNDVITTYASGIVSPQYPIPYVYVNSYSGTGEDAWTMIYGTVPPQTETVSWNRPIDHQALTDTYDINVEQFTPPAFATGTDAEIAEAIDRAHNGEIDLQQDYGWQVGDTRTIHVDTWTDANNNSHAAADIDIVISSFDEYENCGNVVQFDFKQSMGTIQMNSNDTNVGGYGASQGKASCDAMATAMPQYLKDRMLTFDVKASAGNQSSTIETISGNKLALRSEVEVAALDYSFAGEGVRVALYQTRDDIKKPNGKDGSNYSWWLRSPRKDYNNSWCRINQDGYAGANASDSNNGIAPFGCL